MRADDSLDVLLIEDNPGDARLIEEQLRDAGPGTVRLEWSTGLEQGRNRAGQEAFDVLLLDLSLPESTGLETLRRAAETMPSLPIVVLTGWDDERVGMAAVQHGAQDFLVKGQVDGRMLLRVMRYACERKQLERTKDDFISMVTHELRTPLTAIREGVSQVHEEILGPTTEKQRRFLGLVMEDIDRLNRLVDAVLDVSRLSARRLPLYREWCDLRELALSAGSRIEPRARKQGLALEMELPDAEVRVWVDRDRMLQVLMNLLDNALKYTERGSIRIALEERPGAVCLSVEDTGCGIPENEIAGLFQRFHQVRPGRRRPARGTGLGLFLSKGLVELHGGAIRVDSEPERGSVFEIVLPLHAQPGAETAGIRKEGGEEYAT